MITMAQAIHAAGVVVIRKSIYESGQAREQTLIVHRPHHEDWSLPQEKVIPGENSLMTALWECDEKNSTKTTRSNVY